MSGVRDHHAVRACEVEPDLACLFVGFGAGTAGEQVVDQLGAQGFFVTDGVPLRGSVAASERSGGIIGGVEQRRRGSAGRVVGDGAASERLPQSPGRAQIEVEERRELDAFLRRPPSGLPTLGELRLGEPSAGAGGGQRVVEIGAEERGFQTRITGGLGSDALARR
jgi:hypothetical protein